MVKRKSRLPKKALKRKMKRLSPEDTSYAFSVRRRDKKDFTDAEIHSIASTNEAVVEYDVIDLYFGSEHDAEKECAHLKKKGFKVTSVSEVSY